MYFHVKHTELMIISELVNYFGFDRSTVYDSPVRAGRDGIATPEQVAFLKSLLKYSKLSSLQMCGASQRVERALERQRSVVAERAAVLYEGVLTE